MPFLEQLTAWHTYKRFNRYSFRDIPNENYTHASLYRGSTQMYIAAYDMTITQHGQTRCCIHTVSFTTPKTACVSPRIPANLRSSKNGAVRVIAGLSRFLLNLFTRVSHTNGTHHHCCCCYRHNPVVLVDYAYSMRLMSSWWHRGALQTTVDYRAYNYYLPL